MFVQCQWYWLGLSADGCNPQRSFSVYYFKVRLSSSLGHNHTSMLRYYTVQLSTVTTTKISNIWVSFPYVGLVVYVIHDEHLTNGDRSKTATVMCFMAWRRGSSYIDKWSKLYGGYYLWRSITERRFFMHLMSDCKLFRRFPSAPLLYQWFHYLSFSKSIPTHMWIASVGLLLCLWVKRISANRLPPGSPKVTNFIASSSMTPILCLRLRVIFRFAYFVIIFLDEKFSDINRYVHRIA